MATSNTAEGADSRVSMGRMLAFIGPCVPFAALGLPMAVTLPEFYATQLQVGGIVGVVFMIVRAFDIFALRS